MIEDLDTLTPDWSLLEWDKYIYTPLNCRVAVPNFARGCPFTCSFCEWGTLDTNPLDSAMDRQWEKWLHSRIDALPEKLRQPLALAALGDLKLVEIAVILGLPEGTVRRRIHTARARLRLELQVLIERKGGAYEG